MHLELGLLSLRLKRTFHCVLIFCCCIFSFIFIFLVQRNLLFDLGVRIFVKKKHFKTTFIKLIKKTVVTL